MFIYLFIHEQHLRGHLWLQSDRQMTATNIQFDGMSNDSASVCLDGVAEAVEWTHVLEQGLPKRTTQRIVIYPPSLSELSQVLASGDWSNVEDGHEVAYQRIASACTKSEQSEERGHDRTEGVSDFAPTQPTQTTRQKEHVQGPGSQRGFGLRRCPNASPPTHVKGEHHGLGVRLCVREGAAIGSNGLA
jgi:hypothetical protein